ncbi:hypothetical protein FOG50_00502 [Hanseniaspora uvarum]|nr:hypothetical protein FOG50_00502 [Hanseniaspora uvarum]
MVYVSKFRNYFCALSKRQYKVLAMESSCDDSCVSIISDKGEVLYNKKETLADVIKSGGVQPNLATVHHLATIPILVQDALSKTNSKLDGEDIKMICVTRGPGMPTCLTASYQFAKGLAVANPKLKFVGVHHMLGHLLTSSMEFPELLEKPFLSLLVSGGHTQLVLTENITKHTILIDMEGQKAVGDSLDKCARLLKFKGDMIAKEMELFIQSQNLPLDDPKYFKELARASNPFTKPLAKGENVYAKKFCFSGLDSQLRSHINKKVIKVDELTDFEKAEWAYRIQHVHFQHIMDKIKLQFAETPELEKLPLVISGGVSANMYLRGYCQRQLNNKMYYPKQLHLCTDNSVMIGWAGLKMYEKTKLVNTMNSTVISKWPLSDLMTVDGAVKDKTPL